MLLHSSTLEGAAPVKGYMPQSRLPRKEILFWFKSNSLPLMLKLRFQVIVLNVGHSNSLPLYNLTLTSYHTGVNSSQ